MIVVHPLLLCLHRHFQRKKRRRVISAAAAAATGATPIPFSDAPLLVTIEATMLSTITVVFGFEINKSILVSLLSTVVRTSGTTTAGKTVVANLLKLISGAGTVAGAAISGSTAAVITTALGEAYIGMMTMLYNGEIKADDLNTKDGKEKFKDLFKKRMKKNKKMEKAN